MSTIAQPWLPPVACSATLSRQGHAVHPAVNVGDRAGPRQALGRATKKAALIGSQQSGQVLTLPLVSHVALLLSQPRFPHLYNGDDNSSPGELTASCHAQQEKSFAN